MVDKRTELEIVEDFHKTFGHPILKTTEKPSKALIKLRLKLLKEELEETEKALEEGNWIEVFDGLLDLDVIQKGTVLAFGFKDVYREGFEEVMRSNMSKLGEDGNPIYREDGKILKGPNFFKPNLVKVLKDYNDTIRKQKSLEV